MKKNNILYALLAGVLLLHSGLLLADLQTGSVTNLSGSNNISNTNAVTITLRWSMQSAGNIRQLPGSVITSTQGVFSHPTGRVLSINNKVLSKTITPSAAPSNVSITETLRIPKSLLYTAAKLGLTQISYARSFTDCPGPTCNTLVPTPTITFNLSGSTGSSFGITSYKLRFDNDQVASVVGQGDELKSVAYINVTRTGTIRGVWEVATPATTPGKPAYKILQSVQRQLTNFNINEITSPPLPTDSIGIYLVRFRFQDPVLAGELPTLRYNVTIASGGTSKGIVVKALQPAEGATLSLETEFEWEAIPGASAYKLEFITPPAMLSSDNQIERSTPIAGMLVKSDDAKTLINKAVMENLVPGQLYWWHVIGLNKNGKAVGMTDWVPIEAK